MLAFVASEVKNVAILKFFNEKNNSPIWDEFSA